MIVFLNGKFVPEEQALVSVFDRSFLYGDGLFETILVANGVAFRWRQHLDRLWQGAAFLGINPPYQQDELARFATALISENRLPKGLLRLTLSRGIGPRGYSPRRADSPTLVMTLSALAGSELDVIQNWRLRTSSFRLPADQALARFKSCNKLPQILARGEAERDESDEALLCNTDGFVVEGASSNLFWIKQDAICTPPLASGILSGVTRLIILELCRDLNLQAHERNTAASELFDTDGVFLSLSSFGVVQAASLDGRPIRQSNLTRRLHCAYLDLVRRETGPRMDTNRHE
jgi:branched-chain amino acid aminotransferase